MAESKLRNVSVFVGILSTIVGMVIAIATFVQHTQNSSEGDREPTTQPRPSTAITAGGGAPPTARSGCGSGAPAEVTLSAGHAARGTQVTVYGSCFQPGERVAIRVHATEVGSATADSSGNFTQNITIPASAPPPGFPTDISATGKQSVKTGSAPFETA